MTDKAKRVAIIDIGSNSIRYMSCASAQPQTAVFGAKKLITTRLAEGIVSTGALSSAAMERSLNALFEFVSLAKSEGATPFAYATSAVRDAKNRDELLCAAHDALSLDIDVLSGEREAEYALLGAAGVPDGGIVDIGGGSCQIVTDAYRVSYPLGCVRAKELCGAGETLEAWRETVSKKCAELMRFPKMRVAGWTGVGGTITTLAALMLDMREYDGGRISRAELTQESVGALTEKLYDMGDARKAHPLLVKRHDVIIFGALILQNIMRGMGIDVLRASDADGMEGYFMYLRDSGVI